MTRLDAWAAVDAAELAGAFAAEEARWRRELAWDTRELWSAIEHARAGGRLDGLVTRDAAGALSGWTYYACRDGDLQVGALAARSATETAALVDGLLSSPAAATAARILLFAFTDAPGLEAALAARGFTADPYAYLSRDLTPGPAHGVRGRAWDVRDLDATADLLRASYPADDRLRPFAPGGRLAEWRQYAGDLVMGQGCGRFRPSLSVVLPGDDGRLDAVALVTDIGERSAHLAQLAVRPELRGAGLGAGLVAAAQQRCAAAGFARLTLLVAAANTRAAGMYRRAGFQPRARFTCAARPAGRAWSAAALAGQRAGA